MKNYSFVNAEPAHIGQINLIKLQADLKLFGLDYPSFCFTRDDLTAAIENKDIIVVIKESDVFAFIKFMKDAPSKCGYLHQISVTPNQQRKGLAKELLNKMILSLKQDGIEKIGLTTASDTPWGRNLYSKLGFQEKSLEMVPSSLRDQVDQEFTDSSKEKIYMELEIDNALT